MPLKNANANNGSIMAEDDEFMLRDSYINEYEFYIGDYGVAKITTKSPKGLGMDYNGVYYEINTGDAIAGRVITFSNPRYPKSVHISPKYANGYLSGKVVDFRSVAGHELLHVIHLYDCATAGIKFNSTYSETVAYHYTVNVYMLNGMIKRGLGYKYAAVNKGYWEVTPPPLYRQPLKYLFNKRDAI